MAKPSPVTTTIKPKAPIPGIREQWEQLKVQQLNLRGQILGDLFSHYSAQVNLLKEIDQEFELAAGSRESANREKLRLAVENAGTDGLPLAYANFLIRDVKELTEAREFYKRTKDDNGNSIVPVIKEVRGDNNELRIYMIKPEDKKPEGPEGTSEPEGDDETEA